MSSACPKCGAVMSMGQNIDKHVMKRKYRCNTVIYDVNGKFLYHESDLCRGRGRADAIAEINTWHKGTPPSQDIDTVIVKITYTNGITKYSIAERENETVFYIQLLNKYTALSDWEWRKL